LFETWGEKNLPAANKKLQFFIAVRKIYPAY